MSDSPNVVLCNGCKMWFDASLHSCPSCAEERPAVNVALKRSVYTEQMNANLFAAGNRAMQDKRATSGIPQRPTGVGPSRVYNVPGGQDLVSHYKRELQNVGFGE